VRHNLLAVQRVFPGCGITIFNWRDVQLVWWKQYVYEVDAFIQASKG